MMPDVPGSVQALARAPDSLSFQWGVAAGAADYEAELNGSEGTRRQAVASTGATFTNLVPNRTYAMRVRARSQDNVSGFTQELRTCTELPEPPKPRISPVPGFGMLVVVTWDWSDLVLDETDPVAVQILRDTGGGASVVHRSGQRTGTYTDSAGQAGASYAIELISAKADAPGGMNQCRSGGRASVVTPLSEVGSPHETVLRLARLWSGF